MLALVASTEKYSHDNDLFTARSPSLDSAFDGFLQPGTIQSVAPREDIFLDGDDARYVFEVVEGIVCAYRILPDGERHIVSFYFPGDMIGNCNLGTYTYSAQALTPVRLRRIPRAVIERTLAQRPELAQRFLRLAALELAATREAGRIPARALSAQRGAGRGSQPNPAPDDEAGYSRLSRPDDRDRQPHAQQVQA